MEMSEKQKELNQYFTPPGPVNLVRDYLLKDVSKFRGRHSVLECCAGDGGIARVFRNYGHDVLTNDVDEALGPDVVSDFVKGKIDLYHINDERPQWVITNPPFTTNDYKASDFVKRAMHVATHGVAFLVRSSFLEPCKDRKGLLKSSPPSHILVLPRISFTRDGKTDSANYHWLIWTRSMFDDAYLSTVYNMEWYDRADVKRYKYEYLAKFAA